MINVSNGRDTSKRYRNGEIQEILSIKDYKTRKEIIQKYGYSDYSIWFQEESFFNYWQVNGFGGVPLYEINLAKRRKLRGNKFKKDTFEKIDDIEYIEEINVKDILEENYNDKDVLDEIDNEKDIIEETDDNRSAMKRLANLMQRGNLTVEICNRDRRGT